ncbi:related to PET8-Protein of the mitochondrial carrier family (MCF) [Sporisorium reilianum f. sp. reilianum]|uniref:Related to PET8-Protein of the mitochondrial carrier family (MCF) n=1 Tax=Sporisorium reilianum f. sp. reilianum TaxID=72559 RepID=A0A2N8UJ09_9BASI|nr:related to PET8-Protein of the mitochondrial carrier family (MCF) [Sporisorium reilianum f. sp. reilianum]
MFLRQHTPFQANHRPTLRRNGSSSSSVSLQVHETLLAAKARDLSTQCGLGLADEDAETSQAQGAAAQPESKTKADRAHLFVGGPSSQTPSVDPRAPKRHSTKRSSLRGYAQARWARHESLRERVLSATNVSKLEWEANAALLHHSYPLAILLLYRAAVLGSASACEQLANLYADGVTRGTSPAVTLVYRDALRSLAWILEALRLHERRLAAQVKAASSSSAPCLRLAQIWQGPLRATQLLVQGLLSPNVAAFDPCQKTALFLPIIEDLADSQCTWTLRPSRNGEHSAQQAPELWTELEDTLYRWTARMEADARTSSLSMPAQQGPDDVEEHQLLVATMHNLDYHLRVLRAIQATRFLTLEPYAENVEQVESAWLRASATKPNAALDCPDPSRFLDVLTRAKGRSGRLYDETLFRDLQGCAQAQARSPVATDYPQRRKQPLLRTNLGVANAQDRLKQPRTVTDAKERLRDLAPADVETTKQMEENARPALTMRVSSGYAAPQSAVVSISASGEQQNPRLDGASASSTVRQKYGRTVSSSSLASSSTRKDLRASEPSSPTDSVRTGYSLGVARPRRPSSVVSVTPSLLFPPEKSQSGHDKLASSEDYFAAGSSRRARASSSSFTSPSGGMPRPRVTSLYSSAPALVTSKSSLGLVAASVSTTSQQNLHALASANPTSTSASSRRRTGSNASLGSLNPRITSILPKTSPSILEAPEASVGSSPDTATRNASATESSGKHSAAADTLRRLKGRRSHTDLRALHSARNESAPPVPLLPASQTQLKARQAPTLRRSTSTVFVSLENLPDERSGDSRASANNMSTASKDSAMEHLSRTQARISHQSIPSVLEGGEAKASTAMAATTGPPFASALAAGALSGLTVDLLFFPIDTIKTRLQSAQGFWAAGGFTGVYRGLASTAVGSAPGAAVFFTTYESMKPALVRWAPGVFGSEGALGPAGVHMAAASIAEVAACLIRVPTEVIKSRQQTMTYGKGTTTFQAFKKVFQEAGGRGYYRGFGSTVGREIPFTCIQFPLYERLKLEMARSRARSQDDVSARLMSDQELVRNLPTWQAGLAGSIAGAIAAGLTTPLDVVKTRIMLHTKQAAGAAAGAGAMPTLPRGVNTDIIPTLLHIGRTEGVKTLFSGFLPRTMWIGLGGAVFLGTFDAGIKTLS